SAAGSERPHAAGVVRAEDGRHGNRVHHRHARSNARLRGERRRHGRIPPLAAPAAPAVVGPIIVLVGCPRPDVQAAPEQLPVRGLSRVADPAVFRAAGRLSVPRAITTLDARLAFRLALTLTLLARTGPRTTATLHAGRDRGPGGRVPGLAGPVRLR